MVLEQFAMNQDGNVVLLLECSHADNCGMAWTTGELLRRISTALGD